MSRAVKSFVSIAVIVFLSNAVEGREEKSSGSENHGQADNQRAFHANRVFAKQA
jgi:hypothetical protein